MTQGRNTKFGAYVRRVREGRGIGLREMARKIGVSATYVSMIERDEFPPPAENKIKAIAEVLGLNVDELLAMAGKIPSDLVQIIKKHPTEMAIIIRGTNTMSEEEMQKTVLSIAEGMKKRKISDFDIE